MVAVVLETFWCTSWSAGKMLCSSCGAGNVLVQQLWCWKRFGVVAVVLETFWCSGCGGGKTVMKLMWCWNYASEFTCYYSMPFPWLTFLCRYCWWDGALAHGPQKNMKEEVHPAIMGKRSPSMLRTRRLRTRPSPGSRGSVKLDSSWCYHRQY